MSFFLFRDWKPVDSPNAMIFTLIQLVPIVAEGVASGLEQAFFTDFVTLSGSSRSRLPVDQNLQFFFFLKKKARSASYIKAFT